MAPRFVPAVGDRVNVKAWKGAWYEGKAVASREKDSRTELRIHVDGFGTQHDLWLAQTSSDLRRPVAVAVMRKQHAQRRFNGTNGYDPSADTWKADRVISKKRFRNGWRWRMRWVGWPPSKDTYEPYINAPDLIDEFEEQQERMAAQPKAAAPAKKAAAPPPEPYSTTVDDEPSAAFALQQIAAQAVMTLRSAIGKRPRHKLRVARIAGAPWIFRGIRASVCAKAAGLANADTLVRPITAAPGSRGDSVVDEFSFNDPTLGERLLQEANRQADWRGEGATYLQPGGNAAALLPQWRFVLRTKRTPNAAAWIDVYADLAQLVAAGVGNAVPYFKWAPVPKDPTGTARLYSEEEEEAFSLAMAAALQRLEARVGEGTVPQLPWLHMQAFL